MNRRTKSAAVLAALSMAGCVPLGYSPILEGAQTVGDIDRQVIATCRVSPDPSDVAAVIAAAPPIADAGDVVAAICTAFRPAPGEVGATSAGPRLVYGIRVHGRLLRFRPYLRRAPGLA